VYAGFIKIMLFFLYLFIYYFPFGVILLRFIAPRTALVPLSVMAEHEAQPKR